MKVENLKSLSSKIVALAQKQKVEQHFKQFLNVIQQILRNNNRTQAVSPHKENLFQALNSFDQMALSYSEKNLFNVLSYDDFVGNKAVQELDKILHDEQFDPTGVLQKIEEKFNAFKQFLERNKTIESALQIVPTIEDKELQEGESLLEITFSDAAAIKNIVDFDSWIDIWTKIIRAFSQLVGEKPESSRIVFVQKSSPLIIDIATACGLIVILGQAVDAVLKNVEKYLRIRTQVQEIKKLKLENKEIEKALKSEADAFSEKSSQEIAKKITSGIKPKPSGDVVNGVSLAVKNLFVFIDKGGRVDCPSASEDNQDEPTDLFNGIRALQQAVDKLKLLPEFTGNEKDENDDGNK